MLNTNAMALRDVESLIILQLNKKKNTEKQEPKKQPFRMEDTLLGKMMNPETKEFFYTKCILKPISKFGQISDITSLSLIVLFLCSSMTAHTEGSLTDVDKLEKAVIMVYNYLKVTGAITLPFIVGDFVQQEKEANHKWKTENTNSKKEEEIKKETLKKTLKLVKALKQNNQSFEYNFARSLLSNADISGNTTEYNKKLLILLSDIIEEEKESTLISLANHLDSQNKDTIKNASREFLNNKIVKQLVKTYLP